MANHPFEQHIPPLRRYALALVRDRGHADDLVQDTLERALRKSTLFRRNTNLRAWLFSIMHNVYVNQVRTSASQRTLTTYVAAPESEQEGKMDDGVTMRDLSNALEVLAPEQREVVLLVGLKQFSYEETADVLGVPLGTVMSRLARGRERLRTLMAGETSPYLRRIK